MFRLFRKILILPFTLAWIILSVLPVVSVPEWLVAWMWRIDPCETNAQRYLMVVDKIHGYDQIESIGNSLYETAPSCDLAATLGFLAVQHNRIETAIQWYRTSCTFDPPRQDLRLHFAIALSPYLEEIDDEALATQILSRKDVSMSLTRRALDTQALSALIRHQWSTAESIIERIFSIEDPPYMRWMRWVVAAGQGREREAEQFYQAAFQQLTALQVALYQTYGWYILGHADQGRAALQEALAAGATPATVLSICRQLAIEPPPPSVHIPEVN